MRPTTVMVGPIPDDDDGIAEDQTLASAGDFDLDGNLVVDGVANLGYDSGYNPINLSQLPGFASEVEITSTADNSGVTFTVYGLDANGKEISESIPGSGAAPGSVVLFQHFSAVARVTSSGDTTGDVKIGTTGVGSSRWVSFDEWALSQIAIQCSVAGTATYTVQQTLDDPNSPTNPVSVQNVVWLDHADLNLVGATDAQQGNYAYTPKWGRILLDSNTDGIVTATYIQAGNVML